MIGNKLELQRNRNFGSMSFPLASHAVRSDPFTMITKLLIE